VKSSGKTIDELLGDRKAILDVDGFSIYYDEFLSSGEAEDDGGLMPT